MISRYWDRDEESDLVRFVRLASTNQEHMLYATRLQPGVILSLVFDAETPFSTIRSQASRLVRSLIEFEEKGDEENGTILSGSIAEILSDVPPPNPSSQEALSPGKMAATLRSTKALGRQGKGKETEDWPPVRSGQRFAPNFSRESSPAQPRPPLSPAFESSLTDVDDPLAVTVKSSAAQSSEVTPSPGEIAETRPGPAASAIASDTMEPVSPSVFNLKYACLLIPRFAHHRLVGDLARNLGKWVEEICVAFGWRLESISVRPEYLQWVVSVPPVSSPGYLMRIMRQHTSERIFADFPRLARENPSGDFWAPGYLIMGGAQPPPPHLIKNFIAQTRHRQGISQQLHT
ncbi:MAG: transposase [Anaerolineales bacterium]|nr:transposase [Anaerolineales bacterium]